MNLNVFAMKENSNLKITREQIDAELQAHKSKHFERGFRIGLLTGIAMVAIAKALSEMINTYYP